ncbi:MAG: GTPase ObgE [Dehalococcoidia bacterium]
MLDLKKIELRAGNGGNGSVSFIREALLPKGGPGGGNGGHGGNIIFTTDSSIISLDKFLKRHHLIAENGKNGLSHKKNGSKGKDLIVKIPVGTEIWNISDEKNKKLVADLRENNESIIVAKGGNGGFGNAHFVNSINQEPLLAESGQQGQKITLLLNLKFIADIGIIGLPNAGKSSLLSVLTQAKPKIANYPFTTIDPNLGVISDYKNQKIIVDIPGIIEGASSGYGLGHKFLKHIQRTKFLLHLVDGSEDNLIDKIIQINNELKTFDKELIKKPQILCINKCDLEQVNTSINEIEKLLSKHKLPHNKLFFISTKNNFGIDKVKKEILSLKSFEVATSNNETEIIKPRITKKNIDKVVSHESDNLFRIIDEEIIRLVRGSNMENWDARVQLFNILTKRKITNMLINLGIKNGDTLIIDELEFEWE